ncbi:MDR family MFS transporter [Listeria costaricensis]|uniref:MDR family MFS transporter n=1 Tax=Listeria costaricensis TaxID=2026604 RepID=UPI000C06C641|nr:MFS transporter [Listeria costaricensis]
MFKMLHPNVQARIIINFLSKLIATMIFPFMAIYFTTYYGAKAAGVLLMMHVIIQFLAGVYGGYLTDRIGRRQLMIWGEGTKAIAYLGMMLVNSPLLTSPGLTFLLMLVIAIAQGLITPASDAMLIDVSTPESRTFMYSVSYWANNLSLTVGIMIGGWLFSQHLFELLLGLFILSLVTTGLTILWITETFIPSSEAATLKPRFWGLGELKNSYMQVIKDRPFLLFTLSGICVMTIEYQRNNFISVQLAEKFSAHLIPIGHWLTFELDGIKMLSLLTTVNTICIVLFTVPVAKWLKNKNQTAIMYTGFVLFAIGFSFSAMSLNLTVLLLATLILSAGELLYVPTRQTIMADLADEMKRGTYMAFNGMIYQIGRILASVTLVFAPLIGSTGVGIFILGCGIGACLLAAAALKQAQKKIGSLKKS